jgi:hypothetical protein
MIIVFKREKYDVSTYFEEFYTYNETKDADMTIPEFVNAFSFYY